MAPYRIDKSRTTTSFEGQSVRTAPKRDPWECLLDVEPMRMKDVLDVRRGFPSF